MLALWRGWLPSVIGVVPYVGLNFGVYETLKDVIIKMYGELTWMSPSDVVPQLAACCCCQPAAARLAQMGRTATGLEHSQRCSCAASGCSGGACVWGRARAPQPGWSRRLTRACPRPL